MLKRHSVDAVIHFAAYAYVGESVTNPRKYFRNNVAGTLNLLDAMLDAGVRDIVFSSTCATYGEPEQVPISEDHPQNPVNPYGETKLAVEKMLHWYAQAYGLRYAALRYFNAAGADPDGEIGEDHDPETHLIPLAIEAALRRARRAGDLRHRLPDARRHRDPRLHPRRRSGRRARARAGEAARRAAQQRCASTSAPAAGTRCARWSRRSRR